MIANICDEALALLFWLLLESTTLCIEVTIVVLLILLVLAFLLLWKVTEPS